MAILACPACGASVRVEGWWGHAPAIAPCCGELVQLGDGEWAGCLQIVGDDDFVEETDDQDRA